MRRPRNPAGARVTAILVAGAIGAIGVTAACAAPDAARDTGAPDTAASVDAPTTSTIMDTTAADTGRAALLERADGAVTAIADRDWEALAALAHPERGVRFAPYGHVEPEGECTVTLSRQEISALATDSTTRCWGHFDGTGEPIRMDFSAYYERFLHEKDYEDARRGGPDERLGQGNTLNNLPGAFGPGATFVEYHVPGTEQYGGMDWGSLRLVFIPTAGGWRLAGVVHDQWTI